MRKKKLKDIFNRLRSIIDELESEIYSDPAAYTKPVGDPKFGFYAPGEDDDGYPD